MSLANKYLRVASKALLLTGYLFLFATQFNHRFYSIANFVEYHCGGKLAADHGKTAGHGSLRQNLMATASKAHLGLDKRYSNKSYVKLPFTDFAVVPAAETVARIYYVPLKVYSSSLLPTNGLRGPPCA
jgi:hypothetical protein